MNVKQEQDRDKCTKPCSIIIWSYRDFKRVVNMQCENFLTHTPLAAEVIWSTSK